MGTGGFGSGGTNPWVCTTSASGTRTARARLPWQWCWDAQHPWGPGALLWPARSYLVLRRQPRSEGSAGGFRCATSSRSASLRTLWAARWLSAISAAMAAQPAHVPAYCGEMRGSSATARGTQHPTYHAASPAAPLAPWSPMEHALARRAGLAPRPGVSRVLGVLKQWQQLALESGRQPACRQGGGAEALAVSTACSCPTPAPSAPPGCMGGGCPGGAGMYPSACPRRTLLGANHPSPPRTAAQPGQWATTATEQSLSHLTALSADFVPLHMRGAGMSTLASVTGSPSLRRHLPQPPALQSRLSPWAGRSGAGMGSLPLGARTVGPRHLCTDLQPDLAQDSS